LNTGPVITPPAARLAGEIIDRFIHHAEIVSIQGRSYRIQNRPARRPEKHGDYDPIHHYSPEDRRRRG
jgi:hypothetical protein